MLGYDPRGYLVQHTNKKLSYRRDTVARVYGRYAVQGHSTSLMLVLIENPRYATFY